MRTIGPSARWIGVLLFTTALGCGDGPTGSDWPASSPGTPLSLAATQQDNACSPTRGRPGRIIEAVPSVVPWAVAVRDDGLAYVSEISSNRIAVMDTRSRTVTGYIPVGSLPTGVAFSPDGGRAYTANQGDNTVSVIDVAAGAVIATISAGGSSPFSVEVSPDGALLFVGNNDNTILMVDTQSLQILKTVIVGFATNAFAISPGGRILYASHFVTGDVSEIDMFTGTVLRTFILGGVTQGMAINRKGTHLYVANQAGFLTDLNLLTGQVVAQVPIDGVGFGVGVTPDDNEAWITLPLDGKVQIFRIQQGRITGTLNVGGEPRRVGFSQRGRIGAISNTSGNYVTFVR